jgi:hypothetical protein
MLAREIFNAGYVWFITTGDCVTFQPILNSYVNPDHLSYFKFIYKCMHEISTIYNLHGIYIYVCMYDVCKHKKKSAS